MATGFGLRADFEFLESFGCFEVAWGLRQRFGAVRGGGLSFRKLGALGLFSILGVGIICIALQQYLGFLSLVTISCTPRPHGPPPPSDHKKKKKNKNANCPVPFITRLRAWVEARD